MIEQEKQSFNDEPVYYCLVCNGLHLIEDKGKTVCMDCGTVDYYGSTSIQEWLE